MEPERILATAIGSCLFSGIIPVLSMELVVGAAAVALPATYGIPLVLGCATAQMVAKTGLYACASASRPGQTC